MLFNGRTLRGRVYVAALLGIAAATAFAADTISARIAIDPVEFPWHKTTTLSVIVEAPGNAEIAFPDLKGHLGGLELFGAPAQTSEALPDGRKRVTERYTLEAPKAEAGKFTPEPVTVTVTGSDPISLPVQEISVRDLTKEEEEQAQQFAPALDPLNVPKRVWEFWQFWAGMAVAAVLLTGAFAWYRWRRRHRPESVSPALLPWQIALQRLDELQGRNLVASERYGPYYVELSDILRRYIEDRFDIRAPERTTPEFLVEASISGKLSDDQQRLLAAFLRHCDRVKFAQYEPTRDDAERHFGDIKRFVEETVPVVKPEEAAA